MAELFSSWQIGSLELPNRLVRSATWEGLADSSGAVTDRLIELILEEDRDVLKELLTTQKVVATASDKIYFGRRHTPEERATAAAAKKAFEAYVGETLGGKNAEAYLANLPDTDPNAEKDTDENEDTSEPAEE